MSDLLVVTNLDQALDSDSTDTIKWVRQKVSESIINRDISIIMSVINAMIKVSKETGLGLACGLYLINRNWDTFEIDDKFEDYVFTTSGLHKHTIDRYLAVWAMYEEKSVPENLVPQIQQHNIKAQIPIAKAIEQGYEIGDEQWENLAGATDYNEVSKIVRDIKGKEPRKGSLQLYLDRDGSIKGYSNHIIYDIGWLDPTDDDEVVQKAVARIVSNSGILRR